MAAPRYFTGKPCKRGHISERWVATKACIACSVERVRQLYRDDPEYFRSRSRVNGRRLRAENPEQERLRSAEWRLCEPEKARAAVNGWARRNPDKKAAKEHRRRARKRGAGGSFTSADIVEIAKMQKGRCAYCRIKVSRETWHIDHIIPLAKGGHNGRSNIQILCEPCNRRKGAQDPVDFGRSLGGLL